MAKRICSVEGCERPRHARGWCSSHYWKAWSGGVLDAIPPRGCAIAGCERKHYARGWCPYHYHRWLITGNPLTPPTPKEGNKHAWKGGRYKDASGYVRSLVPGTTNDYVAEHRQIMEEHLGRPLRPEETVHHINGVRDDNRLENLELWTSSHPSGQRVEDKIAWAREILALYENFESPQGVLFMLDAA